MEINTNQMTAIAPSSFGMPACAHASARSALGTTGLFAGTGVSVRDRQAGITGDMGLAFAYVPGTSAWSPPLS